MVTPAMIALEVRAWVTRHCTLLPPPRSVDPNPEHNHKHTRAHTQPCTSQSTLGIWFLRRRRFPFVGLLQVLFFAICTYTFVFAVGADCRSFVCAVLDLFPLFVPLCAKPTHCIDKTDVMSCAQPSSFLLPLCAFLWAGPLLDPVPHR